MELKKTVYRVMSAKLRVQRGPGREDLVVARPVAVTAKGEPRRDKTGNVKYLDSAEEPTLIEFDEHCQVNVAFLLKTGALAPFHSSESGEGPTASGEAGAQSEIARAAAKTSKNARSPAPVVDGDGGGADG